MIENFLPTLPLWLVGIVLVFVCVLAFEAGRLFRQRMARRLGFDGTVISEAEGYIIGAIFGLFAFMIAITYSIALERFDERWNLVVEEATSVSRLFLRAELLDEPMQTQLRSTLRDYARTRIAPHGVWNEDMARQLERSHQLRQKLWGEARVAAAPYRDSDLGSDLIDGMNDLLTVGTRRELAGTAQIPSRILNAMLVYLVVAAASLGYVSTDRPKGLRVASTLLFALFAMAIILILDLDRPRAGSIEVPQTALVNLVATLDKVPLRAPPSSIPEQPAD